MDENFWLTLPYEFEANTYRSLHVELVHLGDEELLDHYKNFGREEGRTANGLVDRDSFAALIPKSAAVLEVGPFCNPLIRGPNVSYFDVLSEEALIARARSIGLDPAGVPHINYVSPAGELSAVNRCFDAVISSHCLEHQSDLVNHLQEVAQLLLPGGAYFLLVPDKRYCFDHFLPLSNLAEVIVAHYERRKVHTLRSVIECRALTTHNDNFRHWLGDHGVRFENFEQRLKIAIQEFNDAKGSYIDVHAWYFTPDSASEILSNLQSLSLSPFQVHRVYPSRYGANEFWMILKV
jgi:SAM-dependent methyltransferase